jgi:hypothetical protein
MISEKEFIERIICLPKVIPSKTGKASYTGFRIETNILHFHRVVPKTNWNLDLKELYHVYINNIFINTTVIKKETGRRVNSPSVALLLAIKCIDLKGNRIN